MFRNRNHSSRNLAILAVLLLAATLTSAQNTGAIWTTLNNGSTVNGNVYDAKADVYLNGGPQNTRSNGLPAGTYYFQVTNPSGSLLLSTDDISCRQVTVDVNGRIAGATGACPHLNGDTNTGNGSTPVQLIPFSDTDNPGGEYKVWLTPVGAYDAADAATCSGGQCWGFVGSASKTDNFKVKQNSDCDPNDSTCNPPPNTVIFGVKFYDANTNGVQDNGEIGIPDWLIKIDPADATGASCTHTGTLGLYGFEVHLNSGNYTVAEANALETNWLHTTATSGSAGSSDPLPGGNHGPDFGNVCIGTGGGLTLGFWSNKNGQNTMGCGKPAGNCSGELAFLSALNLRNADGSNFDPATYTSFRNWILSATATNMANMLSAQLATMELNVVNSKVDGGALVYTGAAPEGCSLAPNAAGFISVNALMADANTLLGANGNTTAAGQARTCQEFDKTALDNANNDRTFVQAVACSHTFDESGCTF
jgi:hypothetical protein